MYIYFFNIGKLDINLCLSWSALLVEVSIEDLYLIVVPNQEVKYDSVKEQKRAFDAKQAEIDQVEKAKKMEAERGGLCVISFVGSFSDYNCMIVDL